MSSFFSSFDYHQDIILYAIQLHLKQRLTNQYLANIFLDWEKELDNDNSNIVDILFKPQLDWATDWAQTNNDSLSISTKILWDLVKKRDKFASLV